MLPREIIAAAGDPELASHNPLYRPLIGPPTAGIRETLQGMPRPSTQTPSGLAIASPGGSQKPDFSLAPSAPSRASQVLALLKAIPEEELWIESRRSGATRGAYRTDVAGFMAFLGIQTTDELRQVDRGAVLAFVRHLEKAGAKASTVRRKLSALSSLFGHLVRHHVLRENPCREVPRPTVNAQHGTTPAFSKSQARALLDAPSKNTLVGLRDRAILSVGFQAGPRRSGIVRLKVKNLIQDSGHDCLRFIWKGGHEHTVALHPQTGQRIRDYLERAGHGQDLDGPLFRPVRGNQKATTPRRHLHPKEIDRILKRYVRRLKLRGRYSAHSMRATFVTVTLQNGASLEHVQTAAGHADPRTTKLYDRRGYDPEQSAAFFATY